MWRSSAKVTGYLAAVHQPGSPSPDTDTSKTPFLKPTPAADIGFDLILILTTTRSLSQAEDNTNDRSSHRTYPNTDSSAFSLYFGKPSWNPSQAPLLTISPRLSVNHVEPLFWHVSIYFHSSVSPQFVFSRHWIFIVSITFVWLVSGFCHCSCHVSIMNPRRAAASCRGKISMSTSHDPLLLCECNIANSSFRIHSNLEPIPLRTPCRSAGQLPRD